MKRSKRRLSGREHYAIDDQQGMPSPTGDPTKYIIRLCQLIRRAANLGQRQLSVVLYVRESTYDRIREGKLKIQLADLRKRAIRLGKKHGVRIKIVDWCGWMEHGWALWKSKRPEFVRAVTLAKKHSALIVAVSTDRLVRNKNFKRHGTLPTEDDFENLIGLASGIELATLRRPDAPEEAKSLAIARGIAASEKKSGRRAKAKPGELRHRRWECTVDVRTALKKGMSYGEVGKKFGISKSTVFDWRIQPKRKVK